MTAKIKKLTIKKIFKIRIMTNFAEWVEKASSSPDASIRQENESKLLQYRSVTPDAFMKDCISEFQNENLKPQVRQAIATILSMTISNEMQPQQGVCWLIMDANFKDVVKKM